MLKALPNRLPDLLILDLIAPDFKLDFNRMKRS